MKLCRYGNPGQEKPGMIDSAGKLRDLSKVIGDIDGQIGSKTHKALGELGVTFDRNNVEKMLLDVEHLVQAKFPKEFKMPRV